MAGPDLPRPREPFTSAHLQRWPMGAERAELLDGQLYWSGEFDERDAMVARRALPGSRIRVKPGVGLIAGPVLEDEPESRERTDEEGTRWHEMNGMTLHQRRGERNWTMRPLTREERRRGTGQLAAYRAEGWARTVAAYAANPADVLAAWHYLTAHPVFWTYLVPSDLADIDPREVDEATWARIEAEGWLSDSDGLAYLDVSLGRSGAGSRLGRSMGPCCGHWMFQRSTGPGSESAAPRHTTRAWTWPSRPGKRQLWRWPRRCASATATTGRRCPSRSLTVTTQRDDAAKSHSSLTAIAVPTSPSWMNDVSLPGNSYEVADRDHGPRGMRVHPVAAEGLQHAFSLRPGGHSHPASGKAPARQTPVGFQNGA
jgi:hypothetical protein